MFDDFVSGYASSELTFEQVPFDHPLFIMFSSGTTGTPKCMVHSVGVRAPTNNWRYPLINLSDCYPGDTDSALEGAPSPWQHWQQ